MPKFTSKIRKIPQKKLYGDFVFCRRHVLVCCCGYHVAKVLTESFHPLQVAWSRQLGLFMGIVVLLVQVKGQSILQDRSLLSAGFARLFSSSFSPNVYICNISGAYCRCGSSKLCGALFCHNSRCTRSQRKRRCSKMDSNRHRLYCVFDHYPTWF